MLVYIVKFEGVKSLWGDCSIFSRLGTGDTDRWRIKKGYVPPISVLGAESLKNAAIAP